MRIDQKLVPSLLLVMAAAFVPLGGCSSGSDEGDGDGNPTSGSNGDGDGDGDGGDTSSSTATNGSTSDGPGDGDGDGDGDSTTDTLPPPAPCEGQNCSDHGTCMEDGEVARCVCDDGYAPQGLACVRECSRPAKEKCFEGEGLDPGDDLVVDLTATRTEGVAPLYVFFDATETTSTETERPFHELAYCWNFDDGDAGCFGTTGLSKNEAYGPVAGHVFESPGTYEVVLTVRDKAQREAVKTITIEVEDPDEVFAGTNTTCVSGEGNFEGCPEGAATTTESDVGNLQNHLTTGHRVLFRRGESFTGTLRLLDEGPGIVGAFPAEGPPPRLLATDNGVTVHDPQGRNLAIDWRIMDFEVDGQSRESASGLKVETWPEDLVHLLLLRFYAHDLAGAVQFEGNGIAIQDSELRRVVGGAGRNILYGSATDLYIAGSIFDDSTQGEHAMRLPHVVRGAISNNYIGKVPDPRLAIKLHAPDFSEVPEYTEYVALSDNIIEGNGGQSWMIDFGPQNEVIDQRVRNILFESNIIKADRGIAISVLALGEEITIRQNLFLRESPNGWVAVDSRSRGVHPDPNDIWVYGNTVVTETGAVEFCGFGDEVESFTVANNLLISPEPGSVFEAPVSGGTVSGNVIGGPEDIMSHPPQDWEDFRPSAQSTALQGSDPAFGWPLDFARESRPLDLAAGALEP